MNNSFKFIKKKSKSAFTLAEVLITLVIIGVIAAITVPTIIANSDEQERASRVKKVYSTIANAFTFARSEGTDFDFEEVDRSQENMNGWYNEFMRPRLNTMKVCYDEPGCWNEGDTFYWNGQKVESNRAGIGIGNQIITLILADGTMVNMDMWSDQSKIKNVWGIDPKGGGVLMIFFDINGHKPPNRMGRDVFAMGYSSRIGQLVPAYNDKSTADVYNNCSANKTGVSCISKYLRKH